MRNTFIQELLNHAAVNDKIALIVGDLGYSVVEPFAEEFPTRFINAGVAEQNMAGIAAGMASEGYHVFMYSIANFPLFRCAEQIRNDIDYHQLPVTIVSVGGGLAYGNLGYSHHAIQDFSLIRSMPNMLITAPGDPQEMSACLDYLIKNPQPSYLRINKSGEPNLFENKPSAEPGKINLIKKLPHPDKLLLTTGAVLERAVNLWKSEEKIMENWSLGSMPIWGEQYRKKIYVSLMKYKKIITIEEHLIAGGFGSFLLEIGLNNSPIFLDSKVCGEVGAQSYLSDLGGLNSLSMLSKLMDKKS